MLLATRSPLYSVHVYHTFLLRLRVSVLLATLVWAFVGYNWPLSHLYIGDLSAAYFCLNFVFLGSLSPIRPHYIGFILDCDASQKKMAYLRLIKNAR